VLFRSNRVWVQSELPAPCACLAQPQVPMPCSALWDSSCGGSEPCAFPNDDPQLLAWGLWSCRQPPIPPLPPICWAVGGPGNEDICVAICHPGSEPVCNGGSLSVRCLCGNGGSCIARCQGGRLYCGVFCPPGYIAACACLDGSPSCRCLPRP